MTIFKSFVIALIALVPVISSAQNVLGFHEAQSDKRGDWIPFSHRGKAVWVNPDVSVTITTAPMAEVQWPGAPASVIEPSSRPCLRLTFSESDRARFADLTTRSMGRRIAILHRGELLAAPAITAPIVDGQVIIHGIQSHATARGIVATLTSLGP